MASIALIGPDGAGKTTVSRMLAQSDLLPVKYLYMGVAVSSSNMALPTTRLVEWLKQRRRPAPSNAIMRTVPSRRSRPASARAALRATARLTNRFLEEWYRQIISWYYQARGCVVLYDRHFLFDYAPEIVDAARDSLEHRLHRWMLTRVYPKPDLVIFLDAPGELLFARKGELTIAELERRRQGFLRQGERLPNFVRVDATQPLATVHDEVLSHVRRVCLGHESSPAARVA